MHLQQHTTTQFASFQRQLNYFGFRKLAGKGKMAPCSYVNEAATKELGSLLQIKVRACVCVGRSGCLCHAGLHFMHFLSRNDDALRLRTEKGATGATAVEREGDGGGICTRQGG